MGRTAIESWEEGRIVPSQAYKNGNIDFRNDNSLGFSCGRYHFESNGRKVRAHILYGGTIDIGMTRHDVLFVQGRLYFFLGRDGKIWKVDGARLPHRVPYIRNLSFEGMKIWSDTMTRFVVDRLTPKRIAEPLANAKRRYRRIIREMTELRVLDAATQGRERTVLYFAKGISPDWSIADLVSPRCPDVRHAIMTMLVLGQDVEKAADVIELAAFIEHKLPLFNRQACITIYHSAVEQLSHLCPAWWAQSYLCPWHSIGSIEQLYVAQFCRIMNDSYHREIPEEFAAGIATTSVKYDSPEMQVALQEESAYIRDWDAERLKYEHEEED